ncbi:MAG: GGDEF domain-containing protein [Gammaproteobacteria bacterium]
MGANEVAGSQLLVSFGLISQMAAVILLVVLFMLLRRHAARRPYFFAWSNAWLAFAVALIALVTRFYVFPVIFGSGFETGGWANICYFVYQFGKLAFIVLLLRGILLYLKGMSHAVLGLMRWLWAAIGAFSLISVTFSPSLHAIMFWQGLCNVVVYSFCSVAMLSLPTPRRSLGTRTTGIVLAASLALWLVYLAALLEDVIPGAHIGLNLRSLLNGPNNYLDLTLCMLLAFGMVLVLFEDAKREIDTVHRELRIAHEQLLRESLLDSMTGAYNRRAFNEGAGLEDAKGTFGTLAVLDMDNLKDVNDVYGHKYGDALLKHFASVLRAGLRPSDKLYRLGGDEFLIVMPRTVASIAGPRIHELIATAPSLKLSDSGALIKLRASVGTADFSSMDNIEVALHEADRSMYAQKRSSRDDRTLPTMMARSGS